MSKTDELRAMREAKYARVRANQGRGPAAPATPAPVAPPAPPAPQAAASKAAGKAADPSTEPASDAVCGHRNMSGRTCTREQGHAAKSHRYS